MIMYNRLYNFDVAKEKLVAKDCDQMSMFRLCMQSSVKVKEVIIIGIT